MALSENGWQVVVAGRTAATLEETVGMLAGDGLAVVADVADEASVDALFDATTERFGRVDLLFNNAGLAAQAVPVDELPADEWIKLINVNVTGSFLCARAAFGRMRNQDPQGGRIINNGSISATTPRLYSAPYTASKHAVTGLTKSLALDGRQFNIACGQIDIGNVSSDMTAAMSGGVLQADGTTKSEPTMGMDNVAASVVHMASLPLEANVLTMTVMASGMPFVGRG
jgi:NAD(P)-dependent dehydrogenase (short-subunit alcohol dehydrogenase family)